MLIFTKKTKQLSLNLVGHITDNGNQMTRSKTYNKEVLEVEERIKRP